MYQLCVSSASDSETFFSIHYVKGSLINYGEYIPEANFELVEDKNQMVSKSSNRLGIRKQTVHHIQIPNGIHIINFVNFCPKF